MAHDPTTITTEDFVAEIRAILAANPEATNPVHYNSHGDADGCAYNGPNGRRCVIGEYLYRKNEIVLYHEEGNGAGLVMERRDYPYEVRRIADRIQCYADGRSVTDPRTLRDVQIPRTWGQVLDRLDRLADIDDYAAVHDEEEVTA